MRETRGDTVQGKEKFVEQFTNPEVGKCVFERKVGRKCGVMRVGRGGTGRERGTWQPGKLTAGLVMLRKGIRV